ncbi:MAG: N-acetyltransferase [Gammaproteobacteria bacterium]|nr:N-acetyltransferase [Gammaproteobacteria bacterium]
MNIREEKASDIEKIWKLNSQVFGTATEANLVNTLRECGCTYVSLVAETEDKIVGHILFTPVELIGSKSNVKIMGLAPMAVQTEYQNKGIGSLLVLAGLDRCRALGYDAVVVLGHPGYYPRFGFLPSASFGVKSEYEVPEGVFMVMELVPGSLKDQRGVIKYHAAFSSV